MAAIPIHPTDVESPEPLLSSHQRPKNAASTSPSQLLRLRTWGVAFTLIFFLDLSSSLIDTPLLRICESIICQNYYRLVDPSMIGKNGSIEEKHCKINPVQEELALLFGCLSFFTYLPGLFLAIPFGIMADKYGRRWLMVMNIISLCFSQSWTYIVCAFPEIFSIRMLWFQGIFTIFGGGSLVISTLFHVVFTDVTPEFQRSTVFCYAYALIYLTYFVGPPLSSILMDRNPWIPFNIGICLMFLSIPIVLALPETLQATKAQQEVQDSHRTGDKANPHFEPPLTAKNSSSPAKSNLFNRMTSPLISVLQDSRFLLSDWRLVFLMSAAAAIFFADLNGLMLFQYVSKRYSWPLSKTAYLTSFRGAASVITMIVFIPGLSACLLKLKGVSAFEKDIILSRISFTLITAGLFIVALAPSIPVFIVGFFVATLGSGAHALVRSLLAGLVKPSEVARLFSVLSIVTAASILVSQPLNAAFYTWGLEKGGEWIGMPFLVWGFIVGLSSVSFWLLRLKRRVHLPEEESLIGSRDADHDNNEEEEENLLIPVATNDLPLRNYS